MEPQNQVAEYCEKRVWSVISLYGGEPSAEIQAVIPENGEEYFALFRVSILCEGERHTLLPETKHWFPAGDTEQQ